MLPELQWSHNLVGEFDSWKKSSQIHTNHAVGLSMYQEKCFMHWGGHQQSWQCWRADAYEQCAVSNTSTKGCNIKKKRLLPTWFQQRYQTNLIENVEEISTIFTFDVAIRHQTSLPFSWILFNFCLHVLNKMFKFRLQKNKTCYFHHQGHCCARSRVFCTWEPGVSAASRARKMLIRWSMSSRFLAGIGGPKRGSPSRLVTGKMASLWVGFNFTLMVEKDSNKKRKDVGVLFCFGSFLLAGSSCQVPKEGFLAQKHSWNQHPSGYLSLWWWFVK